MKSIARLNNQILPVLLLVFLTGSTVFAQIEPGEADQQNDELLDQAINELEIGVDAFFDIFDGQNLDLFVKAVRHTSRGRLLLEQYIEGDINDFDASEDEFERQLKLMAARAADLSDDAAEDLWRQDPGGMEWAKLRLSELYNMVKSAKKYR